MNPAMSAWIDAHSALLLCVLGSVLVTQLPKVLPVTFLRGDSLPPLLRHWLSFVPVSVMAALVGPDVLLRRPLQHRHVQSFLMVSLPALLVAWWGRNYFVTIAFGIGLVILARWLGWY